MGDDYGSTTAPAPVIDEQLQRLGVIAHQLDEMSDDERTRGLAYLNGRFGVQLAVEVGTVPARGRSRRATSTAS